MGMHIKATPMRMLGVAIFVMAMSVVCCNAKTAEAFALQDHDVTLTSDVKEGMIFHGDPGSSYTLDLAGHNITALNEDAITVNKGVTLTITGGGVIEATGYVTTSINNERGGSIIIDDAYIVKDGSKGAYYAIANSGSMTLNSGAVVEMKNDSSTSLIRNHNSGSLPIATMTINGGRYIGGTTNIKNEDGIVTITGGDFGGVTTGPLQNSNEMTITGGTFTANAGESIVELYQCADLGCPAETTSGKLVITGGVFNGDYLMSEISEDYKIKVAPEISGGTYNVASLTYPSYTFSEALANPTITGGVFTNNGIELPVLPDGYYAYILGDGSKLVTDQKVDFESDKFVLNLTMGGENGVLDLDDFVLQNAAISIDRLDDGNIEMNGAEIIATHPGTVVVTVEFNGETQTYVINIAAADETVDDNGEVTPPVDEATDSDNNVTAPNTGIATDATSGAADGASILATITTALAMLVVLAGIRIAAKEND